MAIMFFCFPLTFSRRGFLFGGIRNFTILAETKQENMKKALDWLLDAIIIFSLLGIADLLGFDMHNYKLFILIGICYFVGLVYGAIICAIICEKHFK